MKTTTDYISGKPVPATPEETDAVQVMARVLVEDYGYPKAQIATHPQWRVSAYPSDTKKSYPVDIAVFTGSKWSDSTLRIIVECKKKTRSDGLEQLKTYLRLSAANLGVWFNGEQRVFIQKRQKDGRTEFDEIPNIPRNGERVEDIGKYRKKDLAVPVNLKVTFRSIRNYLAGRSVGATRDEVFAQEIINLVFCKIYDERFTEPDALLTFRAGTGESSKDVANRLRALFRVVKTKYSEVFSDSDDLTLDDGSIAYIVGELHRFAFTEAKRDVIAEAFETFIGQALKGSQGQFFTPRNVVRLLVEIVDPGPDDQIIDPACGSGGFLVESLRHVWSKLEAAGRDYGWTDSALSEEKQSVAIMNIAGIDKDSFLSRVTKAYMAIVGDGKGGIFCEDSLTRPEDWHPKTQSRIGLGRFDVLLTNPPFGKKIVVNGERVLGQYDLARNYKTMGGQLVPTTLRDTQRPDILFVERSMQLLKRGGRMAIVLPETFFHAPRSKYVMSFMQRHNIQWIVDLPHNTFRPHNNAKCLVVVLQKDTKQQDTIDMAVAEEMGHDHQGKDLYRYDRATHTIDKTQLWDDIRRILAELKSKGTKTYTFAETASLLASENVYVPRYYWKQSAKNISSEAKKAGMELVAVRELIRGGVIQGFDGHGSPSASYKGKGMVPYVRVADIVNWEVYKNPTALVPERVYREYVKPAKELREGDVLFVRRGSYRIGSVAIVSPLDTKCVLTREIVVLRILDRDNAYDLDPFYLLYLLSHRLVQRQGFTKTLIETTLPNMGDRWKDLMLPIAKERSERVRIAADMKAVIENKWKAIRGIAALKRKHGELVT